MLPHYRQRQQCTALGLEESAEDEQISQQYKLFLESSLGEEDPHRVCKLFQTYFPFLNVELARSGADIASKRENMAEQKLSEPEQFEAELEGPKKDQPEERLETGQVASPIKKRSGVF